MSVQIVGERLNLRLVELLTVLGIDDDLVERDLCDVLCSRATFVFGGAAGVLDDLCRSAAAFSERLVNLTSQLLQKGF